MRSGRVLSGNHCGWIATTAREIREAGRPVSLDFVRNVVARELTTAANDGHVTAAENGLDRKDARAGQQIWIEETIEALRRAALVGGTDEALKWVAPQDGLWKVKLGKVTCTVYGRAESAAARDRHMLGDDEHGEVVRVTARLPKEGYLLAGWSEATVEVETGGGEIRRGRHTFEVHPLALAIPPMRNEEQEAVRADIEKHGVRMPLVLYPDANDKTVRGKPKLKVLDGRHRLQFASALGKPIKVEVFEGTEMEARDLVASLNLYRRQLLPPQQALAIVRLYGEQAKRAAKEAQIEGQKRSRLVRADLHEPKEADSSAGKWEHRAHKMAGGLGNGISPRSIAAMDVVEKAPETAAKVDSGEIRTVSAAVDAAAAELGKPKPANPWLQTVRSELTRARGHLANALEGLDVLDPTAREGELAGILDEIDAMTGRVREALKERGHL